MRTTANSIGYVWAALFVALAEKRGVDPNDVRHVHPERRAQGVHRPRHPDLPARAVAAPRRRLHRVLRRARAQLDAARDERLPHPRVRGRRRAGDRLHLRQRPGLPRRVRPSRACRSTPVAPTLFTFLAITTDVLQEVAKFRAARRVWARLMRDALRRRGPAVAAAADLRVHRRLDADRAAAAEQRRARHPSRRLAAALAGVQTMHVSAYDEALGVPTESAATLALRTQQVVAFETGLTDDRRPARRAPTRWRRSPTTSSPRSGTRSGRSTHGAVRSRASSPGEFARELGDAAYRPRSAVESGERTVVGVNRFPAAAEPLEVFRIDPASEAAQVARSGRARRAGTPPRSRLRWSGCARTWARGARSCRPPSRRSRAYATIGEIVAVLREAHGGWVPTAAF